jgi:amino acid adenylation domain-containing protein/non-ribosomal peptide synthase protein (TIGR01720 family)
MFETSERENRAAIDFLLEEAGIKAARPDLIAHRPDLAQRLSFAQRRLWFLHQLNPASPAYNIASAVRLQGTLDLRVLEASLKEIARRHEVLRTTVCDRGNGPEPCLHNELSLPVDFLDLSTLSIAEREMKARQYTAGQAAIPFDLSTGPLMRVGIARLDRHEHIIVLVMHHIVADAWSMGVLVHELSRLYSAFRGGLSTPLRDLPIQYADYSRWQWEQRERFQMQLQFWQEHLRDLPQLALPTDRSRPIQPSFAGAVYPLHIPAALVARLRALGSEQQATLFMTLLAAFQILMSRYTQGTDVVVGSPIAGRNRRELEMLIGFFVNTLVLRTRWSPGATFRQILHETRSVALQAYGNQDVPFDEVVRALLPGRDLSHNPLFQVMFSVETEVGKPLSLTEISISPESVDTQIAKFDLTLNLAPAADGFWGGLEYRSDLFDRSTVARMAGHFIQLLRSALGRPDTPVAYLPILQDKEREYLVRDINRTEATLEALPLGQLFEEQTSMRPDSPAVEFDGGTWSYAELHRTAAAWAAELCRRGIAPQDRVAICLEPSFEMVVAALAVILAGATYVPLNPSYPDQRIKLILGDTQARILLTKRRLLNRLTSLHTSIICLDWEVPVAPGRVNRIRIEPDHLAYIIYTSGSTGEPKGIAVAHGAVLRLVRNTNYIRLRRDDRVALASNFAFDAATFEIWGALLNGATLVGVPRDVALDPNRFAQLLAERKLTTLFITTALFNQIARNRPDAFKGMRQLLFGGEAVDVDSVRAVLNAGTPARLLHVYGPTECTTFATWHEVGKVDPQERTVPIGRPLSNTRAYVVDRSMELVPLGIPGELVLGGPGLARGYVNRPDLTAGAFVPDPFSGESGGRLYRTGDLVRQRDTGEIEFLGRVDDQVKIRGFRVEPAEISATLSSHPAIKESAVIVREDVPGDRRLVGYVVMAPGQTFSAGSLRTHLALHLPDYMIPTAFMELPRLPLNANGKVDRKALPAPAIETVTAAGETPRDNRERAIAEAWCKVLHRETVGIRQDYFELGGDSITAIQIVSFLRRQGWQVHVRDLFRNPTIEKLAPVLNNAAGHRQTRPLQPRAPLTPVQRWFFDFYRGPVHHFNQSLLLRYRQVLDPARLQTALDAVCERHDALRTVFAENQTGYQQVLSDARPKCSFVDLRGLGSGAITAHADGVQRMFDVYHGPLFAASIMRCDDADRLLLAAHHLVIDAVSWRILIEELQLAYDQTIHDKPIDLGSPPVPWQQWAFGLQQRADCESLLRQLPYWREIIGVAAANPFPRDRDTNENNFGNLQLAAFRLTEVETRLFLEAAGRAFHTEVNDLLLSSLARALVSWGDVRCSILTIEGHGRDALGSAMDASGTVGWFTSQFPFRLQCDGSDIREQIIAVKEALRRVPDGGAGYGMLRYLTARDLVGLDDLSYRTSLSFNYLGQFDAGSSGNLCEFAQEDMGIQIAPELPREHDLDLTAIVLGGRLNVSIAFHPGRHYPERISSLLEHYQRELTALTQYCCERVPEKTAVDFTYKDFSQAAWDSLREQHGWRPEEVEDVCPLSPMQEGLLFHSMYDGRSPAYHLQITFDVEGDLKEDEFAQAWRDLEQRHTILRTAFVQESIQRPVQVVLRERRNPFTEIDLPDGNQASALAALRAADLMRGFDLTREPLNRLTLIRLGPGRAHLIWSCHHILMDGWSFGILSREFVELYRARVTNTPPTLLPPPLYGEYLRWIQSIDCRVSRQFWADYLQDLEQVTSVPRVDGSASPEIREGGELRFEFDRELTAKLRALTIREGVTLNHLIQAAWALLLVRYNNTHEAIFGTIVSGRPATVPGAEHAVGLFINAIPVRVPVPPRMLFVELMRSIKDRALEAEPHHYLPLAEIQAQSEFGRDLINHLLIFENYPVPTVSAGDSFTPSLVMRPAHLHDETHYDLTLVATPGDRLHFKLSYNANAFPADQIERIAGHVETVARAVAQRPNCPITEIAILPATEREKVTAEFNRTAISSDSYKTTGVRIDENALQTPEAIAIHYGNTSVSYRELSSQSNAIALALQRAGVKPGCRVGVLLERSPALIASMLGVWKVRAAYVPIDANYPPDRIRHILYDSRCAVILTETKRPNEVMLPPNCRHLHLGIERFENAEPARLSPLGSDTAYVIYTSGSTGGPKGCEITHRNLANYLQWVCSHLHAEGNSGIYSLFTSIAFDLTVTSLFVPLLLRRSLHVFPQNQDLPDILRAAFAGAGGIDTIKCTPSHISLLKELGITVSPLRVCILGGEAVTPAHVAYLHKLNPHMRVYNEYGPTETTVGCIAAEIPPGKSRSVIGRPIANAQAYVLDRDGHPAAVGVPGEICIGGDGVGQGYLYRPDLTAERFVPDPNRPGCRIYRTGDIGRWLPDGMMDYLGRNDDQVKIRGHRVELAEIRHAISSLPGVRDAVVVAHRRSDETELIAYLVTSSDVQFLQKRCREILPSYMTPARIVSLGHLPLTRNGKLDRRRLPDPAACDPPTGTSMTQPRTGTERILMQIWAEVLVRPEIGLQDNFFELGGHSLKAIQLLSRIHQASGRKVRLKQLFQSPTVEALAKLIDGLEPNALSRIEPVPPQETYELSYAQRRVWLADRMGASRTLNTPAAFVYRGHIHVGALERALYALIERHESLRTAFVLVNGKPRQKIHPPAELHIRQVDLHLEPDPDGKANEIVEHDAFEPFDLAQPTPMRATLIFLSEERGIFLLTMHHIIGDGWSHHLLSRELAELYKAFARGLPNPLAPLPLQYKDYAAWQNARSFAREESFWLEQLKGVPEGVGLAFDFSIRQKREFRGAAETLRFSPELTTAVRELAQRDGALVSYAMLALFKLTLFQLSRQSDLCIGLSCANRSHPEIERLIGFFVNLLPIRTRVSDEMSFTDLLRMVVATATDALEHQDYPLDLLIQRLNPPRRTNRPPLINVVYGFHDFLDLNLDIGLKAGSAAVEAANHSTLDLVIERGWTLPHETAKFDLTLLVTDSRTHLDLLLEYDSALFRPETARNCLTTLEKLTNAVTRSLPSSRKY